MARQQQIPSFDYYEFFDIAPTADVNAVKAA